MGDINRMDIVINALRFRIEFLENKGIVKIRHLDIDGFPLGKAEEAKEEQKRFLRYCEVQHLEKAIKTFESELVWRW